MNLPPNPPSSTASGSDNYSGTRSGRPQQSVWGRPSSQAGARQGLTPIATSDLSAGTAFSARRLIASRVQLFIGVDAPDFNLGLEARLKRAGARTVLVLTGYGRGQDCTPDFTCEDAVAAIDTIVGVCP